MIQNFYKNEFAQGSIEYGLLICLAAVVLIAALTLFGTSLSGSYQNSASKLPK